MMKIASQLFSDAQRRQISSAIGAAEGNTSAEIIPCVATASGRYDRAEDIVGLWFAMIGLATAYFLLPMQESFSGSWNTMPVWMPPLILVGAVFLGFILGVVISSRVGWLRRLFIPARQMHDEVARKARIVFFDQRIHHTKDATGVLLYVSLYERKAMVLADQSITDRLGPNVLQEVCDALIFHLGQTHPADALCQAIAILGEKLGQILPRASDDQNELPDVLVTLDVS